jgi:Na+-translocating ferredoxin:NAD+ oxidoreductase RnfG subunit
MIIILNKKRRCFAAQNWTEPSPMTSRFSNKNLSLLLAANLIPFMAHAEIYMNEEQALKAIFPSPANVNSFARKIYTLTPAEIKKIETASDESVRTPTVIALVNSEKDMLFIDQVLGKHEFITYAVGVTAAKKVKSIEIMEYRETYGQGVRKPEWRNQFAGKDASSKLKLGEDIVNLSGATLSSAHITAGVRRMIETYEVIRARL